MINFVHQIQWFKIFYIIGRLYKILKKIQIKIQKVCFNTFSPDNQS